MKKTITVGDATLCLTSLFPAMIVTDNGNRRTCRTIFQDQNNVLWCNWNGEFRKIRRVDGSKLPEGKRVKEAYVIER